MNHDDYDYLLRHYHHDWGENWEYTPFHQLPILRPETYIPDRLVPMDKMAMSSGKRACVISNLADRRIDKVWNNPDRYFEQFRKFDCIATFDFSLLLNWRLPTILGNVDRSLTLGRKMQELGMRVIPTAMWAYPDTYDICFEALPRHSIVLVSTVGVVRDKTSWTYFTMGLQELLLRVRPSGIILYGSLPALDFPMPIVRHFERVSSVAHINSYQPEIL